MKAWTRAMLGCTLLLGSATLDGATTVARDDPDAAAAFERLKALVGEWEAVTPKGHRASVRYELLSGGSAVVERYEDAGMPAGSEMLTVYHLDGDQLVLTHYCVAGNQPHMRAEAFDAEAGELRFDLVQAANLSAPGAGHMHAARFRFKSADRFTTEWDYVENGEVAFTEALTFTRAR